MEQPLILVVEDNFDTRSAVQWLLQREGFNVVVAVDGEAALRILGQIHPDLIIADLTMPFVDGFELIRQLRETEKFAALPIVVLSAYVDGYLDEVKGCGATAVLRKPEDLFTLAETVRQLLR